MGIKFAVLRTHDGHAMDLLRPNATAKAGVGGVVEVLTTGGGNARVSVNGVELAGHPPQWPDDLTTPTADVVIEQIVNDVVAESKPGKVQITGLPAKEPTAASPPPAEPKPPALPKPDVEQAAATE